MALVNIRKVAIGPEKLTATVELDEAMPTRTEEDLEATARVYWLLPDITTHVCLGDAGETFEEVMGATETAHLLEHTVIELVARTNLADKVAGRTLPTGEDRTWEIEFDCPDDVLVASCLSSAAWIFQWAFGKADERATPDVDAIVEGIRELTAASFEMEGDRSRIPQEPVIVGQKVVEVPESEIDEELLRAATPVPAEDDAMSLDEAYRIAEREADDAERAERSHELSLEETRALDDDPHADRYVSDDGTFEEEVSEAMPRGSRPAAGPVNPVNADGYVDEGYAYDGYDDGYPTYADGYGADTPASEDARWQDEGL